MAGSLWPGSEPRKLGQGWQEDQLGIQGVDGPWHVVAFVAAEVVEHPFIELVRARPVGVELGMLELAPWHHPIRQDQAERQGERAHGERIDGGATLETTSMSLGVAHARDPLDGQGGPVARAHSVAELGGACDAAPGIPTGANVTSVRGAMALFGLGLIETIPDDVVLAIAARPGAPGHPNRVRDAKGREQLGRFGWKADTAELEQFVADAFRNELGITSPLAPVDLVPPTPGCTRSTLEDAGYAVRAVTAYIRSLPPPPSSGQPGQAG